MRFILLLLSWSTLCVAEQPPSQNGIKNYDFDRLRRLPDNHWVSKADNQALRFREHYLEAVKTTQDMVMAYVRLIEEREQLLVVYQRRSVGNTLEPDVLVGHEIFFCRKNKDKRQELKKWTFQGVTILNLLRQIEEMVIEAKPYGQSRNMGLGQQDLRYFFSATLFANGCASNDFFAACSIEPSAKSKVGRFLVNLDGFVDELLKGHYGEGETVTSINPEKTKAVITK
jgi:hypothetical protein